jgi:hypothetical protein
MTVETLINILKDCNKDLPVVFCKELPDADSVDVYDAEFNILFAIQKGNKIELRND